MLLAHSPLAAPHLLMLLCHLLLHPKLLETSNMSGENKSKKERKKKRKKREKKIFSLIPKSKVNVLEEP